MVSTEEQLRELAHAVDCFTEAEVQALGGYAPTTTENQRKRRKGPPYIVFGKHFFYPRPALRDYLHAQVREFSEPVKGSL